MGGPTETRGDLGFVMLDLASGGRLLTAAVPNHRHKSRAILQQLRIRPPQPSGEFIYDKMNWKKPSPTSVPSVPHSHCLSHSLSMSASVASRKGEWFREIYSPHKPKRMSSVTLSWNFLRIVWRFSFFFFLLSFCLICLQVHLLAQDATNSGPALGLVGKNLCERLKFREGFARVIEFIFHPFVKM